MLWEMVLTHSVDIDMNAFGAIGVFGAKWVAVAIWFSGMVSKTR
jgi:hypothetical protein